MGQRWSIKWLIFRHCLYVYLLMMYVYCIYNKSTLSRLVTIRMIGRRIHSSIYESRWFSPKDCGKKVREHSLFWVTNRSKCTDNQINVIITRWGGESHCNSSLRQFTVLHKTIKTYSIQSNSSHPTLVPEPNLKISKYLPQKKLFHHMKISLTLCNISQHFVTNSM